MAPTLAPGGTVFRKEIIVTRETMAPANAMLNHHCAFMSKAMAERRRTFKF